MPPEGFEPAVSASERPQTHSLDRAASGTVSSRSNYCVFYSPEVHYRCTQQFVSGLILSQINPVYSPSVSSRRAALSVLHLPHRTFAPQYYSTVHDVLATTVQTDGAAHKLGFQNLLTHLKKILRMRVRVAPKNCAKTLIPRLNSCDYPPTGNSCDFPPTGNNTK